MKVLTAAALTAAMVCSYSTAQAQTVRETRTTKIIETRHDRPVTKKVVIRRDNGLHRGWSHSRHRDATYVRKRVIVRH